MTKTLQLPPLPTSEEMNQWDKASINLGIPEFTLMENAARAAFDILQSLKGPLENLPILLFMGSGNNGGDAAALARYLLDVHAKPLILHTKKLNVYTGTCAEHVNLSKSLGVPFIKLPKSEDIALEKLVPEPWHHAPIIIDGLLGTGFKSPLRQPFPKCIELINKLKSFVLSLDLPSGYDPNYANNTVANIAVKASATVCFAAAKPALVLPQAKAFTGELFVKHIGIPQAITQKYPSSFNLLSPKHVFEMLPVMHADSHKNTWGHVLIIGGSKNLCGAANLASRAALRSGAGLVTIAAPSLLCTEIKAHTPDLMTLELGDDCHWPNQIPAHLIERLASFSAIAIGPGLGAAASTTSFVKNILALPARPRAIIDADALNILAQNQDLLKFIQDDDILTPHPGEAARLLNLNNQQIQADRVNAMHKLTSLAPCTWILKGASSLLAKGTSPIYILPYDIPNLAVAGSGDVLSGCVAAFAAFKPSMPSIQAAAIAMTVHAHTGHMASNIFPMRGNMASDLIDLLPKAIANLSNFPEVYNADSY